MCLVATLSIWCDRVASLPIPVATCSKAWVGGRSLATIVGLNPSGAWMSLSCEGYVLSGRGICDGSITHPEDSYRVSVCLTVCGLETS